MASEHTEIYCSVLRSQVEEAEQEAVKLEQASHRAEGQSEAVALLRDRTKGIMAAVVKQVDEDKELVDEETKARAKRYVGAALVAVAEQFAEVDRSAKNDTLMKRGAARANMNLAVRLKKQIETRLAGDETRERTTDEFREASKPAKATKAKAKAKPRAKSPRKSTAKNGARKRAN